LDPARLRSGGDRFYPETGELDDLGAASAVHVAREPHVRVAPAQREEKSRVIRTSEASRRRIATSERSGRDSRARESRILGDNITRVAHAASCHSWVWRPVVR